jgi:hypothetical protein
MAIFVGNAKRLLLENPMINNLDEFYHKQFLFQLAEISCDDQRQEIINIINMDGSSCLTKMFDNDNKLLANEMYDYSHVRNLPVYSNVYDLKFLKNWLDQGDKVRSKIVSSSLCALKRIPSDQLTSSLQFALNFIPYIDNLGDLSWIAAKAVGIPRELQKYAVEIILEVIKERNRDSGHSGERLGFIPSTLSLLSMLSFFVRQDDSEGVDSLPEIDKHILMDRLAICEAEEQKRSYW